MNLRFLLPLMFTLLTAHYTCIAKIQPAEGASLHYRLIGFTFPECAQATAYRLEIFEDVPLRKGDSKPIITKQETTNKIIATVPAFGKAYKWRIKCLNKTKVISIGEMHSFSVNNNPFSDTVISRLHVVNKASKYKDLMLFFDNTRTLYNLSGEVLWYLPVIAGISDSAAGQLRDIKLTADGTITFLTIKNVHEIDYDGHVLWSAPNDGKVSGDTAEQYHHEITKLSNGHHMVIGNTLTANIANDIKDTAKKAAGKESKIPCGTLIEYNTENKVVWTWNSCEYIKAGDPATHFNSFYFDEKNKAIYTSYRNINRIVKLSYPSGRVLAQYGADLKNEGNYKGNGMFYSQHNAGMNSDGNLILFNNNFNMQLSGAERKDSNSIPTIAVFREPVSTNDTLQKIWEFSTDIDSLVKPLSSSGGSIHELDKGDYLVCTGLPGRSFIVSNDKKILWNAISEKKDGGWKPFSIYRVSPVSTVDLQHLLFR